MIDWSSRLLLIEDNESDAALLERHLAQAGVQLAITRVCSLPALEQALADHSWDLVLSDYNLPGFDALDALRIVRATKLDLPFIVLSGLVGEEAAVELMQAGAQDYVSKDRMSRLIPAMERELREAEAHREQQRLGERLKAQDERFRLALKATGDGVWERNLRTRRCSLSDDWKAMLGYAPDDIGRELQDWQDLIHPYDVATVEAALLAHRRGDEGAYRSEHRLRCKDGSWKWILDRGVVILRDSDGSAIREIGTMTDISQAKQTELLLRSRDDVLRKLSSEVPGMLYQFQRHPDGHMSMPFVSESICELYELGAEDVREDATAILDRLHPDDLDPMIESINESADNMTRWKGEFRVVLPSRGVRWMSGESRPDTLPDGSILWHGFVHDVTDRRNSDEELRLLQACVNQLNDTIIITDAEPFDDPGPRVVYVNSAFERQTGYTAAEVIGKTPRILQGPDTDREGLRALGQSLRRWENTRAEVLNYTKSGRKFWAELDIAPVADATGWYTNWISVQRDVTARKQAELEREQLIDELETRHAELDAYNHWVAHDLRNPVIAMRGIADLAEIALEADDCKRALSYIKRIAATADQADKLIKSLMTVAKLGRSGVTYAPLKVKELVEAVLEDLSFTVSWNKAEIRLEIADDLTMETDATLLRVIIRNLISNGIKHRHPDRVPVVTINARDSGRPAGVLFRVADNGVGIESHSHSRVFGLFERINSNTDGLGLGLPMVDRAARLLYGRAALAESEVNVGSCFTVWLPSERPHVALSADPVWSI